MPAEKSLSARVIKGALLSGATQLLFRFAGVISLSVTARLLTPEDFGIVASATLVLMLLDRLTSSGLSEYLISRDKVDATTLHTAWTVQFVRQALVSLMVYLAAIPLAGLFGDQRIGPVLQLLATVPLMAGLASPALAILQRDMRFARLMALRLAARLISVVVIVLLAYLWRDYWALAWGNVAATVILALLSYIAYPFAPRLRLRDARAVLVFSLQAMGRQISRFIMVSAPKWVARGGEDSASFGSMSAAMDITALLAGELVGALSQPALPGTAQMKDDAVRLRDGLNLGLSGVVYLAIGGATGLILVAELVVSVLMGDGWLHIVPYVQLLAPGLAAMAVADVVANIMIALGHQGRVVRLWGLSAAVFLVAAITAYAAHGLVAMLAVFSLLAMVFIVVMYAQLQHCLTEKMTLGGCLLRAAVSAAVMSFMLMTWPLPSGLADIYLLLGQVGFGAAGFASSGLVLWHMAGKPKSIERFVLENLRQRLGF